jgi:uracil phosphoribosyltransferase
MSLHIVDHPLANHLLACLRDVGTTPDRFRKYTHALSTILILEATRHIHTSPRTVTTPLEDTNADMIDQGLAVVPILRAGLAMLQPALELFPDVTVGYIGLERDETTAVARKYYCKLPHLKGLYTLCFDPMLATGGSAAIALTLLKEGGADQLAMVSVIASPEGLECLRREHPDVPIIVAGVDRELNDQKYIVPGLGDFGNRLYGTM